MQSGPRLINLKRYELVLIAHLHMRIVKIQRVVQSARILPIHVKEGDIRGKSTSFYILVSGRSRSRELRDLVSFQLDKTGPRPGDLRGSYLDGLPKSRRSRIFVVRLLNKINDKGKLNVNSKRLMGSP